MTAVAAVSCAANPAGYRQHTARSNRSRLRGLAGSSLTYLLAKMELPSAWWVKESIEIMKIWPPNFRRLVLFCMDSSDSESRRIFSGFLRSTRFTFLCTAQISKFQQKIVQNFGGMNKFQFISFHFIPFFSDEFGYFSVIFLSNFAGIARKCFLKWQTY